MRLFWYRVLALTAIVVITGAGQQPKLSSKAETFATGVFVGRSGKLMGSARLFLGKIEGEELQAKVILRGLPLAQADAQGHFKFSGFAPGSYTIVYYPAGGSSIAPAEISVKALAAITRSILPEMRGIEIGTSQPLEERRWGQVFTLLKGHTFWGQGADMKVWNATLRRGPTGPYMEVRKGVLWQAKFNDKVQVKLEAWSF